MRDKQFKFGAIPTRFMLDDRPTARHLRAFAIIGPFDQMSGVKGGTCCTAANRKIAAAAGLTEQECSRMISDLVKWGYLGKVPGARGNRPGLRIVYDLAADQTAFTMIVTSQNLVRIDKNTLSASKTNTPENLPEAPGKTQSAQSVVIPKDTSEEKDNLERKDNPEVKRYSDESARIDNARSEMSGKEWLEQLQRLPTDHAKLASFERAWKAHPEWFRVNLEAWRNWLFSVEERATLDDDITAARAARMLQDTYGSPSKPKLDQFMNQVELDRFSRRINRDLWSRGKHPSTPTALEISRHPACIAAGLTAVKISQIRNKKAKFVRTELWDAFATAISERKEHHG